MELQNFKVWYENIEDGDEKGMTWDAPSVEIQIMEGSYKCC